MEESEWSEAWLNICVSILPPFPCLAFGRCPSEEQRSQKKIITREQNEDV